jgi:hypothetical protein
MVQAGRSDCKWRAECERVRAQVLKEHEPKNTKLYKELDKEMSEVSGKKEK